MTRALVLAAIVSGCGFSAPQTEPLWTQIVSGEGHSCAIAADKTLWCWGDNTFGQLGIETDAKELRVPTLTDDSEWAQVSAGRSTTCGVKLDGTAWCWGQNASSQLGVPGMMMSPVPLQVPGSWTQISVGLDHTCGLDEMSRLRCWGGNNFGQLGDNTTTMQMMPKTIGTDRWLTIQTGNQSTCGLRMDQTLWCWGYNGFGTIGDATNSNRSAPTEVGGQWTKIALTFLHACGIRSDGHLRCWGSNASGQIGDGTTSSRNTPRAVGIDHDDWVDIAVGARQTCGRREDGTMWCWGGDSIGQIGVSESRALVNASPTAMSFESPASMGLGYAHSCAIAGKLGEITCSGLNSFGQLGTNEGGSRTTPTRIDGEWDRIVAGGAFSTCARREDGSLWCWGDNSAGQLGDDIAGPRQKPANIAGGVRVAIVVGTQHACELRNTQVWCWGSNGESQLGDNVSGTRAPSLVNNITATSLSARMHTCAIPATGNGISCWGRNTTGQLGRGDTQPHSDIVPPVFAASQFAQVSTGLGHTCAVQSGTQAQLMCWGDNTNGQLGDGTTMMKLAPAAQTTMGWSAVAAGASHTCGIRMGEMFCWGLNTNGQLGNDSTTQSSVPVQAGNDATWQQVVAGSEHTCGLQLDHSLWCWGNNGRGQLGTGDYRDSHVPVQIGEDKDWEFLGAGDMHTCATKMDGSLWCWGANESGQIGDDSAWRALWTPR